MRNIPRILNCSTVKAFAVLEGDQSPQPGGILNRPRHYACRVTQLAICQKREGTGFALYYCDDDWKTLHTRHFESIDEARRNAQTEYAGVSISWLKPQEAAKRREQHELVPRCDFCRKTFSSSDQLVFGDGSYICYECIDNYHQRLIIRPDSGGGVSSRNAL
ncbi:ClpX C4-type zinc finger protein [Thiohalophilus thiocyanatoxydans]|uniref:ClpX C4-type zinc finger protein n=1 Tax=Thiohalophilus thiocyanatoxydans TaxID=381308 RepID=A0A4R8IIN6_9GAMM|nr:ClpX C4-type zinc finger protein [Thiohalophilus thiocyanatoxydans]TDY00566.1 ClpX C4-type zinc finger protein [Thiohalophilus thiocyanatoxydans]